MNGFLSQNALSLDARLIVGALPVYYNPLAKYENRID